LLITLSTPPLPTPPPSSQSLTSLLPPPPSPTLLPYTTLFRSPYPDCLAPPKGMRGSTPPWPLVQVVPASNRAATRIVASRRSRRSEEHTSELQSRFDLVCRLLLEKKKQSECSRSHAGAVLWLR